MTPRRLEAESIRDAILATAESSTAGWAGPGYNVWEKNTNYVAIYKPRAELERATLFAGWFISSNPAASPTRHSVPSTARTPPWPSPAQRLDDGTPALNLLNSRFVIRQAAFFAERVAKEAGPDPARQANERFNWHSAAGRSETELSAAVR